MSTENSRTWSIFLRRLSTMYGLEDPQKCLQRDPPQKATFKEHILTKITAFHETELRQKAKTNSNMSFLNVSVSGLRGRRHPALSNLLTTIDVQKSRPHLKMLCNDYYTYKKRAGQSGGSPHCRSCPATNQDTPDDTAQTDEVTGHTEDLSHILTDCLAYTDIRKRILPEFEQLCLLSNSGVNFNGIMKNKTNLCQFILDPSSLNLVSRISISDKYIECFYQLSRDYCFAIHSARMKTLKKTEN